MGGHYLVARDFYGPDKDDQEVQVSFREKARRLLPRLVKTPGDDGGKSVAVAKAIHEKNLNHRIQETTQQPSNVPRHDDTDIELGGITPVIPMSVQELDGSQQGKGTTLMDHETKDVQDNTIGNIQAGPRRRMSAGLISRSMHYLQIIFTVPTTIIVSGFIISVIPALKGLFVLLPSSPKAPDGQPPLAFILDTATFLGGASVPLGLIGLGSALARLHVPRSQWKHLPVGSILSLAAGRMILQPVLGVLIVKGLTAAGVVPKDDKVLQFVAM